MFVSLVHPQTALLRPFGSHTRLRARRTDAVGCVKATGAAVDAPADAIALLKKAAKDPSVNKKEVFQALRQVQKAKLQETGWNKTICCNQFWRLVYTADKASVQKNLKDDNAGTGSYFPLTAAQKFAEDSFQNGVYLPPFGKLELGGPITMKEGQKKLEFNVTSVEVKLGPLRLGPFKLGGVTDGKLPFYIFFYVDDDIICAQGKGGGIAMWAKAEGEFLLKSGIA